MAGELLVFSIAIICILLLTILAMAALRVRLTREYPRLSHEMLTIPDAEVHSWGQDCFCSPDIQFDDGVIRVIHHPLGSERDQSARD